MPRGTGVTAMKRQASNRRRSNDPDEREEILQDLNEKMDKWRPVQRGCTARKITEYVNNLIMCHVCLLNMGAKMDQLEYYERLEWRAGTKISWNGVVSTLGQPQHLSHEKFKSANLYYAKLLGEIPLIWKAAFRKRRIETNPEDYKRGYTPLILGEALREFVTSGLFVPGDRDAKIEPLNAVETGMIMRTTLESLFHLHLFNADKSLTGRAEGETTGSYHVSTPEMIKDFNVGGPLPLNRYSFRNDFIGKESNLSIKFKNDKVNPLNNDTVYSVLLNKHEQIAQKFVDNAKDIDKWRQLALDDIKNQQCAYKSAEDKKKERAAKKGKTYKERFVPAHPDPVRFFSIADIKSVIAIDTIPKSGFDAGQIRAFEANRDNNSLMEDYDRVNALRDEMADMKELRAGDKKAEKIRHARRSQEARKGTLTSYDRKEQVRVGGSRRGMEEAARARAAAEAGKGRTPSERARDVAARIPRGGSPRGANVPTSTNEVAGFI